MEIQHPTIIIEQNALTWRKIVTLVAINIGVWTLFTVLGALTSLNNDLRHGVRGEFLLILQAWGSTAVVLCVQSVVVYLWLTRWPKWIASAKSIILGYGWMLLVLMPLQMIFVMDILAREQGFSWDSIEQGIREFDKFATLLDFSSCSAVYFAVAGIKIWQQHQLRSKALDAAEANTNALRLALEQQRGLALRAQLEPHFVFNALNAISALVRNKQGQDALDGISELSELLRYALVASEKNWVKISQEIAFLNDYLSLQRLRYGDRLQVSLNGVTEAVSSWNCQPLLLQPLVENAIRHDLDCHNQPSDIHLSFECNSTQLRICISNPVHDNAGENPGTGLGLRNLRERLTLAYGNRASLLTAIADERFHVDMTLPYREVDN